MIRQRKKWMTYTYFSRTPERNFSTTHLFSFVKKEIPGMVCVPFPTMIVDIQNETFGESWSSSARTKIHRAQRENLAVDRGGYLLENILRLFNPRMRIKGLRGYEPTHFDTMPHVECSAIYDEGVMLCGHVWLIDESEKRAMLYVSASNVANELDDASLTGRAHYFLLWQDGLYLRHTGMETLDLMGYEKEPSDPGLKGVYQWKAATHGKTETLYHYYPVWFYQLRKLRNMLRQ